MPKSKSATYLIPTFSVIQVKSSLNLRDAWSLNVQVAFMRSGNKGVMMLQKKDSFPPWNGQIPFCSSLQRIFQSISSNTISIP
jgi:hypothetical protein